MKKFYVTVSRDSKVQVSTNKKEQAKNLKASPNSVGFAALAHNSREVSAFFSGARVGGRAVLVL